MSFFERPLLAFFGHHKCASTWVIHILQDAAHIKNLHVFHNLENPPPNRRQWPVSRWNSSGDLVLVRNSDIRQVAGLPPFRGFHVVRDPRDLLVSAYFSHRHSHPTDSAIFADRRAKLEPVDKSTGLMLEFDFCAEYLQQMFTWDYRQSNVLEVRFEDLTRDPYEQFTNIFQFLGLLPQESQRDSIVSRLQAAASPHGKTWLHRLKPANEMSTAEISRNPLRVRTSLHLKRFLYRRLHDLIRSRQISPEVLARIIQRHSFEQKTGGRQRGSEDQEHHYRKGIAGDWRNHFEPIHIAEFKKRYNDVLLKLGYETDPDWH